MNSNDYLIISVFPSLISEYVIKDHCAGYQCTNDLI